MGRHADPVGVDAEEQVDTTPAVTAHEIVPGRTLFTERENTDGWIATDLTVDARL